MKNVFMYAPTYLERPALVLVGVNPGSQGELVNKHFACLGEQYRRFSTDHLRTFHDLVDV
jgi:hypothetical protein